MIGKEKSRKSLNQVNHGSDVPTVGSMLHIEPPVWHNVIIKIKIASRHKYNYAFT